MNPPVILPFGDLSLMRDRILCSTFRRFCLPVSAALLSGKTGFTDEVAGMTDDPSGITRHP